MVSTYQSVTGTGKKAVDQLMEERAGQTASNPAYPHPIDLNVLPHIDVFEANGYTKEEMKMVNETKKIMGDDSIRVTATCVRMPVMGGHSESVNVEFAREFELDEVRAILARTPGVELVDDPASNHYPMPKDSHGRDAVLVGRLRRDETQPRTLNMWVVADNLRKGAATNAVQIAEYLVENLGQPLAEPDSWQQSIKKNACCACRSISTAIVKLIRAAREMLRQALHDVF